MGREPNHRTTPRLGISIPALAASLAAAVIMSVPALAPAKAPGKTAPVSHTARQTPPIQLGTSGGWSLDLANGYCCGGTLGSLIEIDGSRFILSNWHVLDADTYMGDDGIIARDGDPVIQPGLIDMGCYVGGAQAVGTLVLTPSPLESNVDAGIAMAADGMVSPEGVILEVGQPADTTVAAFVGQAVKKSGRTTRLTRSKVSGLNATVSVAYENECAGSPSFTKTFTGQILVTNRAGKFLSGGDSGSLLIEDVASYPRAVGLLFAGSSQIAVANPIDEVLAALGATMVGGQAPAGASAEAPAGLQAALSRAHAAQMRNAAVLESVPDGTGHAIGLDRLGRVVIKVLVEADSPRARAAAPRFLDGVPVEVEVVGRIVAY